MEAVRAYYDGHAIIPLKPIQAKKNQELTITILDEVRDERYREEAHKVNDELYGIIKGSATSSEAFAAQKQLEKDLEL